ncbi:hypothetical protein K505DRAFT_325407 [Melanomma pulvis-pyrius CBS 109.77]|uniref:Uncharacterized protein n=1 Tax=Melanomma pulvis-pyrius CBS 109.77 TaxID=1314802 RepID=A0A6A6XBK0_9PLEO|nr:hypothetical protein K505DRAFT_325407 [Melanomma pulvis-pyrius CBS 109.77]
MGHQFDRKAQSQAKHPKGNSGAPRAPIIPTSSMQPGWKGPGYVKKVRKIPRQQPVSAGQTTKLQEQLLPIELQQLLLNVFRDTFPASKEFEDLKPVLQEINDALGQKDFEIAFGKIEFLEAYSVRWSPSRALTYATLLAYICNEKAREEAWVQLLVALERTTENPANIVCFGGGAADLLAFAGLLRYLRSDAAGKPDGIVSNHHGEVSIQHGNMPEMSNALSVSKTEPTSTVMDLHLIDKADWASVISDLHASLRTPPILSKYASATARLSNASFLASKALSVSFTKANILESSIDDLRAMIGVDPVLLALLFTLNDLYVASIPKTTAFLLKLTAAAPKDALLLVVDTPGAESEVGRSINDEKDDGEERESRKYPMHWLMDKVLLDQGMRKEGDLHSAAKWEKVMDEENMSNKLEEGLRYPVLENLRFQVHLFRRM